MTLSFTTPDDREPQDHELAVMAELAGLFPRVLEERVNQVVKWGTEQEQIAQWRYMSPTSRYFSALGAGQLYAVHKANVLAEEAGEVVKDINDHDYENAIRECIQTAAVALAMVVGLRHALAKRAENGE